MSLAQYLISKLRNENKELAKVHDLLSDKFFQLLRKSKYKVFLVDLYHHFIVSEEFPMINLDSLLTFAVRRWLPLAQKIVIPIKHAHLINGSAIFLCSDPIIRIEKGKEKTYYVRCGSEFRKFIPDELKILNDVLKEIVSHSITVVKFYDYWYEVLKYNKKSITVDWYGVKTLIDETSGQFKQKMSKLNVFNFYISYIAVLPIEHLNIIRNLLIGSPIGENSIIIDVSFRELNVKEDDIFFATTLDGKVVLLKTLPEKVIDSKKVLYPIPVVVNPFRSYKKADRKFKKLCYLSGTILSEKPQIWGERI